MDFVIYLITRLVAIIMYMLLIIPIPALVYKIAKKVSFKEAIKRTFKITLLVMFILNITSYICVLNHFFNLHIIRPIALLSGPLGFWLGETSVFYIAWYY